MSVIVVVFFLVYLLLVTALIVGWMKAVNTRPSHVQGPEPFLSVIIPIRDEGNVIADLLRDIRKQSYKNFEVIIVNDHSNDNTVEVVMNCTAEDGRFKLLQSFGEGKKEALSLGISASRGEIIVTTDGDCRVGTDWLVSMSRFFLQSEKIQLAFGGVKMEGSNFFSKLQAHEFLSLIGSAAATSSLGYPTMCNGANLAFRKSAFMEVGGYTGNFHIPSGDDEFLMRKILKVYRHGVVFANVREAVVTTSATDSLNQFVHQRVRWAGKWRTNSSFVTVMLALFVFCFHAINILLPLAVIAHWVDLQIGISLFILKAFADFIFLRNVSLLLQVPWSWSAFGVLQLAYPVYVVVIGALSNFRSFKWKGRKLNSLAVSTIKK